MRSKPDSVGTLGIVPSLAMPEPVRDDHPSPPAPTRLRLQAWAVDVAILAVGWGASLVLLSAAAGRAGELAKGLAAILVGAVLPSPAPDWAASAALAVALWPLLAAPYYALFEGLWGVTPGKRLLGLSVALAGVAATVAPRPGLLRALVRAVLRPVDALFLGLVGAVTLWLSGDGRRLGDLAAGTVVRPAGAPIDDEVRARRIRVGLEAERAVRELLAPLADQGYYVFFNVEHRHFGDIDALVIGPEGVSVVEVKGHKGFVSVHAETGELLRDGVPFEKDILAQIRRQSDHVAGALGIYRGAGDDPAASFAHTLLHPWLVFTQAELVRSGRGDFPLEASTLAVLEDHFRAVRPGDAPPSLDPWGARELALLVQEIYGARPIAPRGRPNNPGGEPGAG